MRDIEQLSKQISGLNSTNSSMAGSIGAIGNYMDFLGIPKMNKITKRVKLMTILYQQLTLENERLKLLIDDKN
jgi:hypothetical protein